MSACGDVNTDIHGSVVPVILVLNTRNMCSRVLHDARRTRIVGTSYGRHK